MLLAVGLNSKEYYQQHRNKRLENNKIWKQANPEQTKLIGKKCYAKNREKYLEQKRQYYSLTKGSRKKTHQESENNQQLVQSNENVTNIQNNESNEEQSTTVN